MVEGITSSDTIVMRPQREEWRPLALLTASSDYFVTVASKTAKEGSKMPRADWSVMSGFPVLIPPESLLAALNQFALPIIDQLAALSFQNYQSAQARDILLPRLINGEVAV
jgi:type I restriction enzyme S subunit